MNRTKIIATLGPSSHDIESLEKMLQAGMNIARLNFSHGSYEDHALLINNVRQASHNTKISVKLLQDLQGPKIRFGILPDDGVNLENDRIYILDTALDTFEKNHLPIQYKDLHTCVQIGQKMLFYDGRIEAQIEDIQGTQITIKILSGGMLYSHKGINIPDMTFPLSAITQKDKADILFGLKQDVDMIALSFVGKAEDMVELKSIITDYQSEHSLGTKEILRIAKIEKPEALKNLKEIIEESEGIMVARGDLGIEIKLSDVPIVQKDILAMTQKYKKFTIVATQMLDSMRENNRPTRAEVSDIANAVIDHADALMLSDETAVGKYPLETVRIMAEVIEETEKSKYDDEYTL